MAVRHLKNAACSSLTFRIFSVRGRSEARIQMVEPIRHLIDLDDALVLVL